jgi:hypothetical protein
LGLDLGIWESIWSGRSEGGGREKTLYTTYLSPQTTAHTFLNINIKVLGGFVKFRVWGVGVGFLFIMDGYGDWNDEGILLFKKKHCIILYHNNNNNNSKTQIN